MNVELKGEMNVACISDERYEELKIAEAKLMAVYSAFKIKGVTRSEILKVLDFVGTFNLRMFEGADEKLIDSLVKMEISKMKGAENGEKKGS